VLKRTLIGGTILFTTLGAWFLDSSRAGGPAWALGALGVLVCLGALYELLTFGGAPSRQRHVGLAAGVGWVLVLLLSGLPVEASPVWLVDVGLVGEASLVRSLGDLLTAASGMASLYLVLQIRQGPSRAVARSARSLWFCVPYVGGLGCLVALLVGGHRDFVVAVVLVAKSSDIGAYFTGKWLGRRKMAPSISKGKTVEGGIGGLVLPALVAAWLLNGMAIGAGVVPGGAFGAALIGVVIAATAIASDLAESLLKRSCEVKDSGTLFAEGGGFLDLADSLLLVAPLTLAYTAIAI
jgi:CDP-diglyceride synthetase